MEISIVGRGCGRGRGLHGITVSGRKMGVSCSDDLNEKTIAQKDSIMEATVSHIKHPWNFFVTCERGWGCCCATFPKLKEHFEVCDVLEVYMTKDLLHNSRYLSLKMDNYSKNELVAVLREKNGERLFYRAVIHEDSGPAMVKVQLLDTGEKLQVNCQDICSLPYDYVKDYPALARQCRLSGISPIGLHWTPEAIEYFSTLVEGQKCVLTVKRTLVKVDAPIKLFEETCPYEVELRVPRVDALTKETRFQDVAVLIAEKYHGILWSAAPRRPALANFLSRESLHCFANFKPNEAVWENIYEQEEKRRLQIVEKLTKSTTEDLSPVKQKADCEKRMQDEEAMVRTTDPD